LPIFDCKEEKKNAGRRLKVEHPARVVSLLGLV
jgi:hypothetical protein